MQPHDPIFGKRYLHHTGPDQPGQGKSVCKCMDCARQRQEYREVLDRLSVGPDDVIIGDANVQKTLRKISDEIAHILLEYDELDTLVGGKIMDKLSEYKRGSF